MWFILVLLYLIILCVLVFVQYYIAKEFYFVAVAKGYETKKYFWICFLLGMVGYLLVIALPTQVQTDKNSFEKLQEVNNKPKNKFLKQFEVATAEVVNEAEEVVAEVARNEWKCNKCGKILPDYVGSCSCGNRQRENF